MWSIWPFAGPSSESSTSSGKTVQPNDEHGDPNYASNFAPECNPPLIICEGFLSAAQSVVWGNEFRTYLGVGHQQLLDQLVHPASSLDASGSRRKRRSGLGSDRLVVFAPIGPVSSLHDRACELFYALRGGTVDYGEQHAREHGHGRWGRHYDEPLCPTWGPPSRGVRVRKKVGVHGLPAHFLGHSLGGPTILKLQQLLRQGFFDQALDIHPNSANAPAGEEAEEAGEEGEGWRAEDLILSVTSVSSPFRGTPLVYSLGSEPLPYPKVRMFSFGDMLSKFIHIAAFLDLPFFDAHADAWHFSAKRRRALKRSHLVGGLSAEKLQDTQSTRHDPETGHAIEPCSEGEEEVAGMREFLKQLWKSDWANGKDCAPWDCTFAERDRDRAEDGWGLEHSPSRRKGKTWYRSYAGGMTVPDQSSSATIDAETAQPGFHRPETYWSLSPLTFTAHLIGHFDYSRLQPTPSFLPSPREKGGDEKDHTKGLERMSSTWWENDGVVPLASQFHPLDCHPDRCRHFRGMPASLPFGKRKKRPESTDLGRHVYHPMSLSSASETATLIDIDQDPCANSSGGVAKEEMVGMGSLLPVPATQAKSSPNRSMLGSAKSAAWIAYFTSLRAFNLHDPPLVTPSEEELNSFLPGLPPSTEAETPPSTITPMTHAHIDCKEREERMEEELLEPRENKWYTFQIQNLDHTSLCPLWTGSEVQKQFWTGMGFFLASVDRKAGYTVVEVSQTAHQ